MFQAILLVSMGLFVTISSILIFIYLKELDGKTTALKVLLVFAIICGLVTIILPFLFTVDVPFFASMKEPPLKNLNLSLLAMSFL